MLSVLAASAIGWAPVTPPINTLARAPPATMSENDNFNPRVPHELEPRASKADLCANPLHEIFPTEELSPVEVTDLQLQALQQADARFFWRFVSPEGKRATGVLRPARRPYLVPPQYADLPLYAPLVRSNKFEVIGALNVGETTDGRVLYQCRARVWPSTDGNRECSGGAMEAEPIEYIWHMAKQPLVRPVCYADDPLQQGISTGPPFGGCWLTDEVKLDRRWGNGGGGDETPKTPPPPPPRGRTRAVKVRRTLSPVMMAGMSSDRPTILPLPKAIKDIDSITRAMLEGLSQEDLDITLENLENAIFNSPPFEKPNEIERRRNLALCYWLKKDPAYYPRLLPNAKEVLRQLRGEVKHKRARKEA